MIATTPVFMRLLRVKRTLRRLNLVGEKQNQPFQLSFNPSLKVDFQGSRVTSDGGLLLVRELDERLGLSALIAENILEDGFNGVSSCGLAAAWV
jgi:predicted ribosome quality control (RQC) complex YloA/Tae2 family protein